MRLIDADKVHRTRTYTTPEGTEEFINEWISALALDKAPTVDAIPIEWLEKCKDRYILCCTIIDDIIEEWREENGRGQMD